MAREEFKKPEIVKVTEFGACEIIGPGEVPNTFIVRPVRSDITYEVPLTAIVREDSDAGRFGHA